MDIDNTPASALNPARLEAFVTRAIGDLTAGYTGVMVSLGSKLGLYKAMAGAGPLSPREVAARAGCAERYVREWLNAQAAGGYVNYHAVSETYELSSEQAMVLADDTSPVYLPPACHSARNSRWPVPQTTPTSSTGSSASSTRCMTWATPWPRRGMPPGCWRPVAR